MLKMSGQLVNPAPSAELSVRLVYGSSIEADVRDQILVERTNLRFKKEIGSA